MERQHRRRLAGVLRKLFFKRYRHAPVPLYPLSSRLTEMEHFPIEFVNEGELGRSFPIRRVRKAYDLQPSPTAVRAD